MSALTAIGVFALLFALAAFGTLEAGGKGCGRGCDGCGDECEIDAGPLGAGR